MPIKSNPKRYILSNPSSAAMVVATGPSVFGIGILGFALTEAIALFALVVALLMLFAL